MKRFWLIIGFLIIAMAIVATACSTEGIERAKADGASASAREVAAPYAGEVAVINAQTDATLKELAAIEQYYKSTRSFDAQMNRQDFATMVLEFQALGSAIRGETEAARQVTAELEEATENADGIGYNALAAARNAFFTIWALAGLGVLLLGFGTVMVVFCTRFERRLSGVEKAIQRAE